MTLELSVDDFQFLQTVLIRHLEEQRRELLHTKDRHLHAEFAVDVERLEHLAEHVGRLLEQSAVHHA